MQIHIEKNSYTCFSLENAKSARGKQKRLATYLKYHFLLSKAAFTRQTNVGQLVLAKLKLVCVERNRSCLYSRQQFANMLLCRSPTHQF